MTGHGSTHTDHLAPWTLAIAVAGATALSACGGHAPARNATLAGATPMEAVTRAVDALAAAPFRMRATQTVDMDLSGVPADAQAEAPPAMRQTISGGEESPHRFSGTVMSDGHAPVRVVLYDGTGYVSGDGATWSEAPFLSQLVSRAGVEQLQEMTRQISSVHDAGRVRVDGIDAERYDATFPESSFTGLGRQLATGMAGALGVPQSVIDAGITALHVNSFTIGFEIARTTGRLVGAIGSGDVSIDLARMAAAMGTPETAGMTGTMRVLENSDERITDQGAHIVVQRPESSGTITAEEFGALLTSGDTG